ncbi:hypothetical protein [Amphritea sp.]|uniref:hypothetical protein n=1 Tax=Amphritea sp. TaxID=1872502 RepID=UPI003A94C505
MKSLVIILASLWVSCRYTDLYSGDVLYNLAAPVGLIVGVISLTLWLVMHVDLVLHSHHSDGYQSDNADFSHDSLSSHRGD